MVVNSTPKIWLFGTGTELVQRITFHAPASSLSTAVCFIGVFNSGVITVVAIAAHPKAPSSKASTRSIWM